VPNVEFAFPVRGKNEAFPVSETPQVTSGALLNVRPFDAIANRMRGGKRPGLNKWGAGTQIGSATQPVVAMCVVDSVA
jgi:hypothetical protein